MIRKIIPVNGHLLIEPIKYESFIASDKEVYEEVGVIVEIPDWLTEKAKKGDKVFFDSWLAAKFPKNDKEYFWLVKWEDVRAVEKSYGIEPSISE